MKTTSKEHFVTSDLKLQAFLRLMFPSSFIGVNRSNPKKVNFIFKNTSKIASLVDGYYQGREYKLSPLGFATNIDVGKSLIFGDFEI